jgi:hypothetical protein
MANGAPRPISTATIQMIRHFITTADYDTGKAEQTIPSKRRKWVKFNFQRFWLAKLGLWPSKCLPVPTANRESSDPTHLSARRRSQAGVCALVLVALLALCCPVIFGRTLNPDRGPMPLGLPQIASPCLAPFPECVSINYDSTQPEVLFQFLDSILRPFPVGIWDARFGYKASRDFKEPSFGIHRSQNVGGLPKMFTFKNLIARRMFFGIPFLQFAILVENRGCGLPRISNGNSALTFPKIRLLPPQSLSDKVGVLKLSEGNPGAFTILRCGSLVKNSAESKKQGDALKYSNSNNPTIKNVLFSLPFLIVMIFCPAGGLIVYGGWLWGEHRRRFWGAPVFLLGVCALASVWSAIVCCNFRFWQTLSGIDSSSHCQDDDRSM